jgi:hypothetical protein
MAEKNVESVKTEKTPENVQQRNDGLQRIMQNWKYIFAFLYIILIILQSVQNIVLAVMRKGGGEMIGGSDLLQSSMQGEAIRMLGEIYSVVNDTATFLHKR